MKHKMSRIMSYNKIYDVIVAKQSDTSLGCCIFMKAQYLQKAKVSS